MQGTVKSFSIGASHEKLAGCALTGNTITAVIEYLEKIKDTVIPKMPLVMSVPHQENELDGRNVVISSDSILAPESNKEQLGPHFAQHASIWKAQSLNVYNPQVFNKLHSLKRK